MGKRLFVKMGYSNAGNQEAQRLLVACLRGQVEDLRWMSEHAADAKTVVNRAIAKLTTREIGAEAPG